MEKDKPPPWVANLAAEDLRFIRSFLLASGSLKAMAGEYGVSYPTIRARLDRLIERLRLADDERIGPFHARLKDLVASGELEARAARDLLDLHRREVAAKDGGDDE